MEGDVTRLDIPCNGYISAFASFPAVCDSIGSRHLPFFLDVTQPVIDMDALSFLILLPHNDKFTGYQNIAQSLHKLV